MLKRFSTLISSILFLTAGPGFAVQSHAAIDAEEARLRATNAAGGDAFGRAVDHADPWAVVGAPDNNTQLGADAGSVYVLERVGSAWLQRAELQAFDGAAQDHFGAAVAIAGDFFAVGAPWDDNAGGVDAGAVYVFLRCAGSWVPSVKLLHPAASPSDRFGLTLAFDGETLAVGAPDDSSCAAGSGSVTVFARNNGGTPNNPCDDLWSLQSTQPLQASNCQAGARFGSSLAIDGSRLIVGATMEDAIDVDRGAVYVFERQGGIWTQKARILAPDGASSDQFGSAVALSSDRILVGASLNNAPQADRGSAYFYERGSSSWFLIEQVFASDGDAGDQFGSAVALDGDLALIAAQSYTDDGGTTGRAYLWRFEGGLWLEDQRLCASAILAGQAFAQSLSLENSHALLGMPADSSLLPMAGAVIAYAISQGQFARFGFGDGSSGTFCSCNNNSVLGREQACLNSSGNFGGKLSVVGSDLASADDFRLLACGLPVGQPALLFSSPTLMNGGAGVPFGNGVRFVGPLITRHQIRFVDSNGRAGWGPGLGGSQGWPVNTSVHFQVWYRDPQHASCGHVYNLASGVSIRFR